MTDHIAGGARVRRRDRGRARRWVLLLFAAALVAATAVGWAARPNGSQVTEGPPEPEVPSPDVREAEEAILAEMTPDDTALAPLEERGSTDERARWCGSTGAAEGCRITQRLARPRPPKPAPPGLRVSFRSPDRLGRAAIPDAADPFVLTDGDTYYFFSTSAQFMRVPVAIVPAGHLQPHEDGTPGFGIPERFDSSRVRIDAMADDPPWASMEVGIWAPTVARFEDRFVMFFAARRPDPPDPPNAECIGRAFAERPEGPYRPEAAPFTCGLGGVHGALDPSIYIGAGGQAYLHVAFGGTSTPLWGIRLTPQGDKAGTWVPLLRLQQSWETWFLENPSMVSDGEAFVLAYSVGDWRLPTYSTGIARCTTPLGPCWSSPSGPWLSSRGDVTGPGGLSFFHDVNGRLMVAFHAYQRGHEALVGARATFVRRATVRPSPALR